MSSPPPRPARLTTFPSGEIAVVWSDGEESYFDPWELRCACACATCVDEMTGQKVLDDSRVPRDVRAEEIFPVGNYGVSVRWSDGHDTGIYTFERLRRLGVRS
jgi:ATP-binding protein involved in chromosome partitioning